MEIELKDRVGKLLDEKVTCTIFMGGHSEGDKPIDFKEVDLMELIKDQAARIEELEAIISDMKLTFNQDIVL